MSETEAERAAAAGARRLATALLLIPLGGVIVLVDVHADATPLVPDIAGHALLAVAGVLLASDPIAAAAGGHRFRRVGLAIAALSVLWALHWLTTLGESPPGSGVALEQPPPESGVAPSPGLEIVLFPAGVATMVWFLVTACRWCADQGMAAAEQRLRRSVHVVGWPWGAVVVVMLAATVVARLSGRELHTETPLAVPLVVGLFVTLAYAAWALLATRSEIRTRLREGAGAADRAGG